jgi:ATP-dependent Clp protease ATP-binding subunit ClpX
MQKPNAYCSFCRKSFLDVGPLVEGPGEAYICGECVELCQSIIEQEKRRRDFTHGIPPEPQGVIETLNRLVLKHEAAKAVLAEAAFGRREGKGRVLLVGPNQSSQVFLAKALAHALEVPFAAGHASGLAEAGKGNPLFKLVDASDFNVEWAQQGVVFVGGAEQPDAQDALLRLWHEGISNALSKLPIDVRGMLFVCGGTFVGLDEAMVGLGRHPEQPVTIEALTAVGARADFVRSLAGIARVAPLDEASLAQIVDWVDFRRSDTLSGATA